MKLTDHSGPNFLEGLLANAPLDVLIIKAAIIATRRPKGARRRDRHICIQFAVNPGTSIFTSAPGYHFQSGIFRLLSSSSFFAYTKYAGFEWSSSRRMLQDEQLKNVLLKTDARAL